MTDRVMESSVMRTLTENMKELAPRAKALGSDILVYFDERQNISYCRLLHRYVTKWFHIGTVSMSGNTKLFLENFE